MKGQGILGVRLSWGFGPFRGPLGYLLVVELIGVNGFGLLVCKCVFSCCVMRIVDATVIVSVRMLGLCCVS